MFRLSDFKRTLQKLVEPMHLRAERLIPTTLAASFGIDPDLSPAGIKDISTTGIYLVTEKRLPVGELVTLNLQEKDRPESNPEHRVSVQARVAALGEDGIGLFFVPPTGLDQDLWGALIRDLVILTDPEQVALLFRTLRTMLFLCRLCQSEAEDAIVLAGGELDSDRTEVLINIALAAERLLASEPDAARMRAHPKLLTNILRDGSWAPNEPTRQLWTGLLVTSCSVDAPGDSNQIFVDLLTHLTPVQAKIFIHACERSLASVPGAENSPSSSIVLSPKEIVNLTGVHDLYRNATELAYLFNLGLIQKIFDFTSYRDAEVFDITPTNLGLELYKHCHGNREKLDPEIVESANSHLLNFIIQPQPIDPQTSFTGDPTPPSPLPPYSS
jgi:hypothetical protein